MTILSSLVHAYEHMNDKPPISFTREKISGVLVLDSDGLVMRIDDLRDVSKKKAVSASIDVPKPVKKSSNVAPNFLWGDTSYTLGVRAKELRKPVEEYKKAFVTHHEKLLADSDDEGLKAFLAFLRQWNGDTSGIVGWKDELLDSNIIFVLESDWEKKQWLHLRPAAKDIWGNIAGGDASQGICLVTGRYAPVARLHPAIKGVSEAQSLGASLSSFNKDSFTSYGHKQGDNAPVSVYAADAYTTALNLMLAKGSGKHMLIGDTRVVFWAEAKDAAVARLAERAYDEIWSGEVDKGEIADNLEAETSQKISTILAQIRKGKQLRDIDPVLEKDVRFFILGLEPSTTRLVVRFFLEDNFGQIIRNYQRFVEDMLIEPSWEEPYPSFFRCLLEIIPNDKAKDKAFKSGNLKKLSVEWMQAVLFARRYPTTLLPTILKRIRFDGEVNALRASILKAALISNFEKELSQIFDGQDFDKIRESLAMLSDECKSMGYLLGRLFAVYEKIQIKSVGEDTNATIKDKFYVSASMRPRSVFGILDQKAANHLADLRKKSQKICKYWEKIIGEIMDIMDPQKDPFPVTLSLHEQALFSLGYYHQKYTKKISENTETAEEN